MSKAKFIFTSYKNSFSVFVENLENLSVEQIKEIERFVESRNGLFDFNSYSFVIQKRLDFNDFEKLIVSSGMNAECLEKEHIVMSNAKIDFGKYRGMFYSELPDSYLLWLKSNYKGKDRKIIDNELKKRNL
jgi:hypothetical protein